MLLLSKVCEQGRDAVVWFVQAAPSVLLRQDQKMWDDMNLRGKRSPI